MRLTVSGIVDKAFNTEERNKTYQRLIKKGMSLQPHFSEPEIRVQFLIFIGRYISKTFKAAIRKQALYGERFTQMYYPLSPAYQKSKSDKVYGKAKKRSVNAKDMFYINSKWLYDNFKYWVKDETVYVGFRDGLQHPKGGEAKKILEWLDKGTRNMQARPLVSLIVDEVINDIERFVDLYLEAVEEKIVRVHGTVQGEDIVVTINELVGE